MAVSKHNLWKRQKNGLMTLVRSHSEWLDRRRARKARKKSTTISTLRSRVDELKEELSE